VKTTKNTRSPRRVENAAPSFSLGSNINNFGIITERTSINKTLVAWSIVTIASMTDKHKLSAILLQLPLPYFITNTLYHGFCQNAKGVCQENFSKFLKVFILKA